MKQDLFPQHWLTNTLLDDGFIVQKTNQLAAQPLPYALDAWLAEHFNAATLATYSEAQLEDRFIGPLAVVAIGSIVLLYVYRVVTWKPKATSEK